MFLTGLTLYFLRIEIGVNVLSPVFSIFRAECFETQFTGCCDIARAVIDE